MRQPSGQLADRLHLVRLAQRLLDPLALRGLGLQLGVRLGQLAGALGHPLLQRKTESGGGPRRRANRLA